MKTQPVTLITGASSGIGQATAELFAANGFKVFGTSRRPDAGTARPYPMLPLDVRLDPSVDATIRAVLDQAGRIDVLVNNAGYLQAGAIEENSLADAQAQFDTNLFGVMRVTNAVLPIMRQQGSGHIINVSSVLGQVALPYAGLYVASKFALEGFSEALRYELRQFNIHVSLMEPGFVKTNLAGQRPAHLLDAYAAARQAALQFANAGVEHGMAPVAVAQAILRAAQSPHPRLRYRIGRESRLLSTLKRLLPEPVFERVWSRIVKTEETSTGKPQLQASTACQPATGGCAWWSVRLMSPRRRRTGSSELATRSRWRGAVIAPWYRRCAANRSSLSFSAITIMAAEPTRLRC